MGFFFVPFFYLFVFHGFTLLFPFLNTVLGLFLFNKTRSAHAKKLRVSQGPRLLPSTELLFNTFWVKIIPSEPNTDWQPNIKQSHFVNSFTEVQMPNPTPLCSDTTAVVLGCLLFFFFTRFFGWRFLLLFKGEDRIPVNPWDYGIAHQHLKSILLVYSSECSFCVKNWSL